MELMINQKPAIIGINIRNSEIQIKQKAAQFDLKAEAPKLNLKEHEGRLSIDYIQCNEAIGYYGPSSFSGKAASDGEAAVARGIDRIVAEGNLMEDVQKNGFIIPRLGNMDAWAARGEIDIAFKPAPDVTYQPNSLSVKLHAQNVQVSANPGAVVIQATPGVVQAYLKQAPEFDIEYVGNNIDTLG